MENDSSFIFIRAATWKLNFTLWLPFDWILFYLQFVCYHFNLGGKRNSNDRPIMDGHANEPLTGAWTLSSFAYADELYANEPFGACVPHVVHHPIHRWRWIHALNFFFFHFNFFFKIFKISFESSTGWIRSFIIRFSWFHTIWRLNSPVDGSELKSKQREKS